MGRWVAAVLLGFTLGISVNAGKLDRVRENVRQPDSEPDSEDTHHSECKPVRHCYDDGYSYPSPAAHFWANVLLFPFAVPHAVLEAGALEECQFLDYPYVDDRPGYLWVERESGELWCDACESDQDVIATVSLENGNDFDGLHRLGGQVRVDTASRVGLLAGWNVFFEDLPAGGADQLFIGDVNLTYRFAQHERAAFRLGVGTRFLSDPAGTDWGVNVLYGVDVFPAKPWVMSMQLDVGNLGNAGVFEGRGTIGYQWRRSELYLGYDYLRIGDADLQGPLVGWKLWF